MPSDPLLKISASGLEAVDAKMRAMTNDLANARTPGYRASDVVLESFPLLLQQTLAGEKAGERVKIQGTFFSREKGSIVATHVPTDVAIEGEGFFSVLAPWGTGYTRDGRFYVNAVGQLLTVAGQYEVLGESGPIVISPGSTFSFSQHGEVVVAGETVNRLQIVDFPTSQGLQTVNGSLFRVTEAGALPQAADFKRVLPGFLESSNADVVDAMMKMVMYERLYGFGTRIMQERKASLDQLLQIVQPAQ